MSKKWKVGVGIAVMALCTSTVSLAAPSKAELMQKADLQSKTNLTAKATARTKVRETRRAEAKKLHAQKRELLIQKRALRGDPIAQQAKMQEIKNVNISLQKQAKGGTN
jgi:hypothetical protein